MDSSEQRARSKQMRKYFTEIESEGNGYRVKLYYWTSGKVITSAWAPLHAEALALSATMLASVKG
jgi:hypothetical protein